MFYVRMPAKSSGTGSLPVKLMVWLRNINFLESNKLKLFSLVSGRKQGFPARPRPRFFGVFENDDDFPNTCFRPDTLEKQR